MGTQAQTNKLVIDLHKTDFGTILSHYYTESSAGETCIAIDWATNSSRVYGDAETNANNAAKAIYEYNIETMNVTLNPPYPKWGWFVNIWRVWHIEFIVFVFLGAVATFVGFYWQYQERREKKGRR